MIDGEGGADGDVDGTVGVNDVRILLANGTKPAPFRHHFGPCPVVVGLVQPPALLCASACVRYDEHLVTTVGREAPLSTRCPRQRKT